MRSGLGSDQVHAVARAFTALFLGSNGSLPKFPFSGMVRGRKYEMKIRTPAETLLGMFSMRLAACVSDLSSIEKGPGWVICLVIR
jgi:hypothetical protein